MPFLFIISGLVMIISAVRGTNDQLVTLLKSDFTGKGNFIFWLLSILLIGAVGYVPDLKPVSRAFLVLVVLALFISNKGVFTQFTNAINTTQQPSNNGGVGSPQSTLTQTTSGLGPLISL